MTQILLIRHAVNDFVKTGKLAGWTPGVHLNDEGKAQAEALGKRLAQVPIKYLYASPLERTMETAASSTAPDENRPAKTSKSSPSGTPRGRPRRSLETPMQATTFR